MKHNYEIPKIEVIEIEIDDVLTGSANADVAWWKETKK